MAPPYAEAKITLTYPLYAADFDPTNPRFLLVGGGGGEGRSGVGNKITLLNASKKREISELAELNLSRDEDSVTTLAYNRSSDLWASVFAGINSSLKEQKEGTNKHFRSFLIQYPTPKEMVAEKEENIYDPQPRPLGSASLFKSVAGEAKPETFQRVLRTSNAISPNGPRLGAVATGLAAEGEIVTFVADTNKPNENDIRDRINLGKNVEAADLDIIATSNEKETDFALAYCTDYDIYTVPLNYKVSRSNRPLQPERIHSVAAKKGSPRPRFRAIRYLTPTLLLILQNLPNGSGAELHLMNTSGVLLLRKSLPKKIKSGTGLAVSKLPFALPGRRRTTQQQIQHAIAIAGADTSITTLTLNHSLSAPYKSLSFSAHLTLQNVHPTSITSVTFSTHNAPEEDSWSRTPAQYLKLASTSVANTLVVHTFPLAPFPPPNRKTNAPTTYVLALPNQTKQKIKEFAISTASATILIAIACLILQSWLEIRTEAPELVGARTWYYKNIASSSSVLPSPIPTSSSPSAIPSSKPRLRDLLAAQRAAAGGGGDRDGDSSHQILIHHPATDPSDPETLDSESNPEPQSQNHPQAVLHPSPQSDPAHPRATKFEDLPHHERESWKKRLVDAGEWAVEEGESVLKGVFFSGLAAGVAGAVGG